MKKILMMTAAVLAFAAVPAFAEDGAGGPKGPKGGAMFDKHDVDGDGTISEDEFLSHARDRFSKMDADGDGTVSKEEAKAGHKKMRQKMKELREKRKSMRESRGDSSGE